MSTDEKPTNCAVNSLFYELDTGDFYYFNGVWKKVSSKVQLEDTGPSGTIEITENGTVDVYDYDYADVNVPGVIPTGTLPITENGNVDVANYATAEVDVDYATINFNLPAFKRTNPTTLSQARQELAATTVGNYALFGGGAGSGRSNVVDAYDQNLTRTTPTALSQTRYYLAATTVGNYALFGGGYTDYPPSSVVDAYDTTLTRTTPTALSQARVYLAATTIGGYALFVGGVTSIASTFPPSTSSVVNAYDTTLTETTETALSQARGYLAATNVAPAGGSNPQSSYALFAGGNNGSSYFDVVDAYDQNLTRSTPTALSQARRYLAATTVGNYALFGGGDDGADYSNVVDAYDQNLARTTPTELSQARRYLAATTVGNYALFGGGYGSGRSNVVDAYNPYHDIQVFPNTKYSFNGSTEQTSSTWQTISMQGVVIGYIKIKNTNVTGD